MLLADGALGVVLLLLWVYCLFDAITSDAAAVRNLPKLTWVLIVIVLSDIGSLLWLVAGRPQGAVRSLPYKGNTGIPPKGNTGIPPSYDRPRRATAPGPDDDAAFLADIKARTEEQRRRGVEQRHRDQQDGAPPPAP